LALIIFVVSEKKAFEHFPIGFNVNLCPAVVAILNFRSASKNRNFVENLPMIIPGQFGFNCPSGFREEAFLPRNDHWKVLYKVCVFYADRKSKMATIAGHRFLGIGDSRLF
jgi:hypothetical protein